MKFLWSGWVPDTDGNIVTFRASEAGLMRTHTENYFLAIQGSTDNQVPVSTMEKRSLASSRLLATNSRGRSDAFFIEMTCMILLA